MPKFVDPIGDSSSVSKREMKERAFLSPIWKQQKKKKLVKFAQTKNEPFFDLLLRKSNCTIISESRQIVFVIICAFPAIDFLSLPLKTSAKCWPKVTSGFRRKKTATFLLGFFLGAEQERNKKCIHIPSSFL